MNSASNDTPWSDVVASMVEAVIYADHDGTIRGWNPRATEVFGFTEDEALGQNLDLIIPERLRDAHWRGYHAAIERGATSGGLKARLTRGTHRDPDRRLYVEMSFAVVTDPSGAVTGAVAVARDVTQEHLAARAARS